jgi:hypothetical protein
MLLYLINDLPVTSTVKQKFHSFVFTCLFHCEDISPTKMIWPNLLNMPTNHAAATTKVISKCHNPVPRSRNEMGKKGHFRWMVKIQIKCLDVAVCVIFLCLFNEYFLSPSHWVWLNITKHPIDFYMIGAKILLNQHLFRTFEADEHLLCANVL